MCVEVAPPRRGAHVVGLGRDGDVDLGTARFASLAFKVGAVVLEREADALLDPQFFLGAARASVARGLVPAELFRLAQKLRAAGLPERDAELHELLRVAEGRHHR